MALEADASRTSFSLMAPTALCRMRIFTLSVLSRFSRVWMASFEPCTSTFRTMGSSLIWPCCIFSNRVSRLTRVFIFRRISSRCFCCRKRLSCLALDTSSVAKNFSPACGRLSRPRIITGWEGPAISRRLLFSSCIARIFPEMEPATM